MGAVPAVCEVVLEHMAGCRANAAGREIKSEQLLAEIDISFPVPELGKAHPVNIPDRPGVGGAFNFLNEAGVCVH